MKLTPWMLTMAAFGIIALLAVGFLFKKLMAAPVAEVKPPERRVLPMAITAIEPGTMITSQHIGNGPAPGDQPLAKDTFTNREGVIGRIAKVRIEAAVPLEGSMFYSVGDHPGLAVEDGKQAVVVRVSETTAVLGQKLKPEQHVDVLLTVDGYGTGARTRLQSTGGSMQLGATSANTINDAMTVTLFKGVKVLSVSRGYTTTSLQGNDSSSVTLELDPEQSRIVSLAQRKGEIDLVYSSSAESGSGIDIKAAEKDRITLHEILGIKPEKEKEKPFRTEHYRGAGRSTYYFEDGERIGGYGYGGDGDSDGSRLQSTGGSGGDWSTDTGSGDRHKDVARVPAAAEMIR